MPIDYKNYPSNWKSEIRPAVMKRAKYHCEFCGVKNYTVGYYDKDKVFIRAGGNQYQDAAGNGEFNYRDAKELADFNNELDLDKYIVIVLTIAHLDHNIENNDLNNLKALCQKCHLNYDKKHHMKNSRETRIKKMGLLKLDFTNDNK